MKYDNPHGADDLSTETAFHAGNARVKASIKGAVSQGVNPGITGQVGQLIPPPPSFDPFHGKTCQGPGLQKNGLGQPKICGRRAIAVLRTIRHEMAENRSLESQAAELNAAFAMRIYADTNGRIPAGSGPKVGHMVRDPHGPIGADDHFVCHYHGMAAHKDHLHPDDANGFIPDVTPVPDKALVGLDHLDKSRQWRTTGQDASFVWVSDGVITVMAFKRDYIAYLAANGTLPKFGQLL